LVLASVGGGKWINKISNAQAYQSTGLTQIGQYKSGFFDEGGAEIPAYDPKHKRLFMVNAGAGTVDVLNIANPTQPKKIDDIDGSDAFDNAGDTNNVSVYGSTLAVAIANQNEQENGRIAFYDTASRNLRGTVEVGALPDMVTFTPDGNYVLAANEGEPTTDYSTDPKGSVSIIDVSEGIENPTVATAGFESFEAAKLREEGVRITGPQSDAAQDLEPEYIAVSPDSTTAYVSLQENNAVAVVDIPSATIDEVVPLGYKDHSKAGNELDAVDNSEISIENQPLYGMYQPDTLSAIDINDETYLVTANEGDAREYDGLFEVGILTDTSTEGEDADFKLVIDDDGQSVTEDVDIDESAFADGKLKELEGLEATALRGDTDEDGAIEELHIFGGRSFAIWQTDGSEVELVYESGDELEQIVANEIADALFNTDDNEIELDAESAASGPEPEGIAVGYVDGVALAFIGLEEVGGVVMFDISDPTDPKHLEYVNNRISDLTKIGLDSDTDLDDALEEGLIEPDEAGDLAPEGLVFIAAEDAPKKKPLLVVGNEVSGTTTIYEVTVDTQ
jgi:DNA-binding beta-propeller fold protein YncE